MQRLYFFFSILILVSVLIGCAPKTAALPAEVRMLDAENAPEKSLDISEQPEVVPHAPPADCPITGPQDPLFAAPAPYSPNSPFDTNFWYGSTSLWTDLPKDGIWYALPHNPDGYTQKIFWWREGYIWNEEPQPELIVTGERVNAVAPPLIASSATNAFASDIGSAMLVGVDFPTPGCWKITGKYAEAELSFVVWVAP